MINQHDGCPVPDQGTMIAGKGPDGKHYFFSVGVDGTLNVTPAAGGATAANQATQITAEQAIQATAGATNGAAVITDANGTIQQYLRGLVKLIAAFITVKIDQTTNGTTNAVFVKNGCSFSVPTFDYMAFTYVGSTNNIATQVFKSGGSGGTTVATLTYTYVAAGAADDDDIATITQS